MQRIMYVKLNAVLLCSEFEMILCEFSDLQNFLAHTKSKHLIDNHIPLPRLKCIFHQCKNIS
jgi:hypothetical protein